MALREDSLFRNPNFARYAFTRFGVVFALYMQYTALTFSMFQLTQDNWTLGVMSLWEVIAALGAALVAGQLVDRSRKRFVFLLAISAFVVLSVAVYFVTRPDFFIPANRDKVKYIVYAIMFCMGIARAFGGPASFSLLSRVVKRQNYNRAITSASAAWQAGAVLGPLVGGLVLGYFGIHAVMVLVLLFLVLSWWAIYSLHDDEQVVRERKENYVESLATGFRFVFKTEIIWAALTLDLVAVFFGGAEVLLPDFAENIIGVGSVGYGWLKSAHGIGSIIMIAILNRYPLKDKPGVKLLYSTAGFGACIILFGLSDMFWLSFLALLLAGVCDAVSVIVRQSILQIYTPENMKGRVSAISGMFINSSNELGGFESGATARLMGTVPAVLFGGTMTILATLGMSKAAPKIKEIEI